MPLNIDSLIQSNFSLAAYTNLQTGEVIQEALISAGFSSMQAGVFAETYRVVDTHTEPNGLSATVFGRKDGTGEKCLTIRGTNDLDDLLTDLVDIALLGTTALQSQYTSLKAQVTCWINDGTQFDVLTEHSFNPHSIVLLTDASKVSPGSTRGDDAWNLAA